MTKDPLETMHNEGKKLNSQKTTYIWQNFKLDYFVFAQLSLKLFYVLQQRDVIQHFPENIFPYENLFPW